MKKPTEQINIFWPRDQFRMALPARKGWTGTIYQDDVNATLVLTPRFRPDHVEWVGEVVAHFRKHEEVLFTTRPALTICRKSPAKWLLATDKKKLRDEWNCLSEQVTDKILTRHDFGLQHPLLYDGGSGYAWAIRINEVRIHPVYLCPKLGMFWLDARATPARNYDDFGKMPKWCNAAQVEPNGTMFVLRRQPGSRLKADEVITCGGDNAFKLSRMSLNKYCSGFIRPTISRKRIFIDKRLAEFRETDGDNEWLEQDLHETDPRHWIYETPYQCQQRILTWARRRLKEIRKHRRPLTRREQLFFRMMAGASALQKQISLN